MSSKPRFGRQRLLLLIPLLIFTWMFWPTPYLYPIRILVTLIHEFSHGIAGLLTGGRIESITIDPTGAGRCWVQGGIYALILPAGYLGSMIFGCLILVLAFRTHYDRYVSLVLGAGLMAMTLLYVHTSTGVWYGLGFGVVFASAGWWLPESVNDLVLSFIGTASCLFSFFDVRNLIRLGSHAETDATLFSRYIFPLPPLVWAALFMAIALVALGLGAWIALRKSG